MNHSEDQKQDIEKTKSSSRFYTYLSYLVILLVPAYIIYQGVFHSAPEKITMSETNADSVSSRQPQNIMPAATGINETQLDDISTTDVTAEKVVMDGHLTEHTEPVMTDTVNSSEGLASKTVAAAESAHSVAESSASVSEQAISETSVTNHENKEVLTLEVKSELTADSTNQRVLTTDVTDPVLSSQSFAEIDQVITKPQASHVSEKQPVFPDEVAENKDKQASVRVADKSLTSPSSAASSAAAENLREDSAPDETDVKFPLTAEIGSDIRDTSAETEESESKAKSDSAAISSRSFAEADAGTTMIEEKAVLERAETFVSSEKNSADTKNQADDEGPSSEIKTDRAADSVKETAMSEVARGVPGKTNIPQFNYPVPLPPIPARYKGQTYPGSMPSNQRMLPYRPYPSQPFRSGAPSQYKSYPPTGKSYQYAPYARPDASYQYAPYTKSDRSYQYNPYAAPGSANNMNRYQPDNFTPEHYNSSDRSAVKRGYESRKPYYPPAAEYGNPPYHKAPYKDVPDEYAPASYPPANYYY